MSLFHFKQFAIKQSDSAMKVGTDSVLLGSLLEKNEPGTILDIGTGTGLLALMMAQRFAYATIDAVEIDKISFEEARYNVNESRWNDRISLYNQSFQEFSLAEKRYDLIVSNPPYYETGNHFSIPKEQRSKARHTETLSFDDLIRGISKLLSENGLCWMVLPTKEFEALTSKSVDTGLFVRENIRIYPKAGKAYNRVVFCLSKIPQPAREYDFVIYGENAIYTQQYRDCTQVFLLWSKS